MRKRFLILTAVLLSMMPTAHAENDGNLLVNGSFKDGISGYGIAYSGKNDTVLPKIFATNKHASDGEGAMEFVAGADLEYKVSTSLVSGGFAYQGIYARDGFSAKGGMEYKLSGEIFTEEENVKMRFIITEGSKAVYVSDETELTGGYMNSISYMWIPEQNYSDVKVRVVFYDIDKGDKIYIDNLKAVPSALTNKMWQPIAAETLSVSDEKVSFTADSDDYEDNAGVKCTVDKNLLTDGKYIISGYVSTDMEKAYVKLSCTEIDGAEEYYIVKNGERALVQLVIEPGTTDAENLEVKLEVFGSGTKNTHTVDMYDFAVLDSKCIVDMEETDTGKIKVSGALRSGNENTGINAEMTECGTFTVFTDSDGEYSFTKEISIAEDELQKTVTVKLSGLKGYSDTKGEIAGAYTLINNELLDSTAQQADSASTVSVLKGVLSEDVLDALKVTVTDVYRDADKDFIADYLLDKDISSADKLREEILKAACINVLDADKEKLTVILDEYGAMLGVDELESYKDLYENVNKENLNSVFKALTNKISDLETLHETIAYTLVKSQLASKATYASAMEFIKTYSDEIGLDMSGYNNLSGTKQSSVQASFIPYVKTENNYTKLNSALQGYVQNAAIQNPTESSPSYSTSSGGGGSRITRTETVVNNTAEENSEYRFIDLADYGWAEESIYKLYNRGVISASDDNCFNPSRNITRAEFSKMTAVQFGITDYDNEEVYSDVTNDSWYYKYVMALRKQGIINGVSEDFFAANEYITRQDICVIIARIFGQENSAAAESAFADYGEVAEYAKAAVSFMNENGYINGYDDNTFRPMNFASRAEVAKILGALN